MRRSLFIFALSMLMVSAGALSGWAQDEQSSDQDDQATEENVSDDDGGGGFFHSILVGLPNGILGAANRIVTGVGGAAGGIVGAALGLSNDIANVVLDVANAVTLKIAEPATEFTKEVLQFVLVDTADRVLELPIDAVDGATEVAQNAIGFVGGTAAGILSFPFALLTGNLGGGDEGEEEADEGGEESEGGGLSAIVGTWDVTATSENLGESERTFVFNDDGTGTYSGDIGSFDITNVQLDGNTLTFDVTLVIQENELPSKFTGTVEDGKLDGSLNFGAGEAKIVGEKSDD